MVKIKIKASNPTATTTISTVKLGGQFHLYVKCEVKLRNLVSPQYVLDDVDVVLVI